MIKVHILYDIKDGPWGGGNQFLRLLRDNLRGIDVYEDDPLKADVILVNSKDNLEYGAFLGVEHQKVIVHRIDGIFSIYRGPQELPRDVMVYDFAGRFADGIIFQSHWSRMASKKNGMGNKLLEVVIPNCSDSTLFLNNRRQRCAERGDKIRLITTTWSDNPKKGFAVYKYLDNNLDFNKYEYVFVGRSSVQFQNIKIQGVLNTKQIAKEFEHADIFVTATQDDACSNSLIEAMSCGLPAVGLESGGVPELIGEGGELFNSEDEALSTIEMVADNLEHYETRVAAPKQNDVCRQYCFFMEKTYDIQSKRKHR